jgi:hypothetical protein
MPRTSEGNEGNAGSTVAPRTHPKTRRAPRDAELFSFGSIQLRIDGGV